jgi:hypothetical protein
MTAVHGVVQKPFEGGDPRNGQEEEGREEVDQEVQQEEVVTGLQTTGGAQGRAGRFVFQAKARRT